jgi:hypothetical protein
MDSLYSDAQPVSRKSSSRLHLILLIFYFKFNNLRYKKLVFTRNS